MYQGLKSPQNARVLFLDMNSYFASVEQQFNPALRNIPMAVVSHIGPAGTVLAASYEAKLLGIRTGTRLQEAWEKCPKLVTVRIGLNSYKDMHHRFMAILRDIFGPEVEAHSIDEAAIPLSYNWFGSEYAHELAQEVKRRFCEELGECMRCSIGIAPNTFLAKLATDIKKPDGLLEITVENTEEILSQLSLTDLPGIAHRMEARLAPWNIFTPLDLYHADVDMLRRQFGIWGQQWYWKLHGYEPGSLATPLKTMSHQHALKQWTIYPRELEPVLHRMGDRLIHRLRRNKFQCKHIGIYLSLKGARGVVRERTLDASTQSYTTIWQTLLQLYATFPPETPSRIRLMAVYFNNLTPSSNGYQADLFHEIEREELLSKAVERVRTRHGFNAIQRGTVINLNPAVAQEKLGFGRIKDKET